MLQAWGEVIEVIRTTKIPVTILVSEKATPETVVEGLKDLLHFGNARPGRPER
jgi:hypothetical protein